MRSSLVWMVSVAAALGCGGLGEPADPATGLSTAPLVPATAPASFLVTESVCGSPTSLRVYPPSGVASGDQLRLADDRVGVIVGPGVTAAELAVYGWVVERTDGAPHFASWWSDPADEVMFRAALPVRVEGCEGGGDGFVKWDDGVVSVTVADRRFRTAAGFGPDSPIAPIAAAATGPSEASMMDDTTIWPVGRLRFEASTDAVVAVGWSSR